MLNGRKLDTVEDTFTVEVSKPKAQENDGTLVVRVTIQRTLLFSRSDQTGTKDLKEDRCTPAAVYIA